MGWMSQAQSHMSLNLRHNSVHVGLVISSVGPPQESRIFRFLKIFKSRDQIKISFCRSSLSEKEDQMGKKIMLWALLMLFDIPAKQLQTV